MEVIKTYASDSLLTFDAERLKALGELLNHPFSLCFVHLKWQQTKGLYYFLLACHILFCITYTFYTQLFYHTICQPMKAREKIVKMEVMERLVVNVDCNVPDEISGATWPRPTIGVLWICLVVFFILYIIKEVIGALMMGKE